MKCHKCGSEELLKSDCPQNTQQAVMVIDRGGPSSSSSVAPAMVAGSAAVGAVNPVAPGLSVPDFAAFSAGGWQQSLFHNLAAHLLSSTRRAAQNNPHNPQLQRESRIVDVAAHVKC